MSGIKLKDISTRSGKDYDKQDTKEKTAKILEELNDLQNLLFAINTLYYKEHRMFIFGK